MKWCGVVWCGVRHSPHDEDCDLTAEDASAAAPLHERWPVRWSLRNSRLSLAWPGLAFLSLVAPAACCLPQVQP